MASAAAGDTTLPPLIAERIRGASRIVVAVTASAEARTLASHQAGLRGTVITVVAESDGVPTIDQRPGDLLFHGVPDVFGRLLDPPPGWEVVAVRERMAPPSRSELTVDVGPSLPHDAAVLAAALATLHKRITQQRGVRPLFEPPPALGLPYIAPGGLTVPGSFGRIDHPVVPGLPDLAVIRPDGDPAGA